MKRWFVGVALAAIATVGFAREASARATFYPVYNTTSGCTIVQYNPPGSVQAVQTWSMPGATVSQCYEYAYWWNLNQSGVAITQW
jgi:hypothetical protein